MQEKFNDTSNDNISYGDSKIVFLNSEDVNLEIYNSLAGKIPIFYARNEVDFKELVKKLIYKGRDIEIKKNLMGTILVFFRMK